MSGGGAKPPRVNPNGPSTVLPTHVVPADRGDNTVAPDRRRCLPPDVVAMLWLLVFIAAFFGLILFGVWMDPVVSIDSVSATGLARAPDAEKNASASAMISPSFDVAVRIRTRWFHLLPSSYTNGTVAVSCAGGAVTAHGELEHIVLSSLSPPVVSATVRAPPTALPGDARDRLDGELRRGEVRLDVSVAYESDPASIPSGGFRALCAVTLLRRGDSTATTSCTVVK